MVRVFGRIPASRAGVRPDLHADGNHPLRLPAGLCPDGHRQRPPGRPFRQQARPRLRDPGDRNFLLPFRPAGLGVREHPGPQAFDRPFGRGHLRPRHGPSLPLVPPRGKGHGHRCLHRGPDGLLRRRVLHRRSRLRPLFVASWDPFHLRTRFLRRRPPGGPTETESCFPAG